MMRLKVPEEQIRAIAGRALAKALEGGEKRRERGSRGESGSGSAGADEELGSASSSLFAGYLQKKGQPAGPFGGGQSSWKRRFFVLRRDLLFYFSGQ